MSTDLLNPRDRLKFPAPFRSLMTACEVKGRSDESGANAFEIRQEHMLPWMERNGIETARSVDAFLANLIGGLNRRRSGTVWSSEFDFNHRWAVGDAIAYFDGWRTELAEAARLFDASTLVLLSLLQRVGGEIRPDQSELGDIATIPVTEREYAVITPRLSVRDRDRWVFVEAKTRTKNGVAATLCWPSLVCRNCDSELEIERDEDDTNDQWRVRCCEQVAFGNSIAEVTINWNLWEGRNLIPFRHA